MMPTWRNWARTAASNPIAEATPRDAEEVATLVSMARDGNTSLKPIGASHSFTAIGATQGIRVNMSGMRGLVSADLERDRVTLWAGTHLWELPGILDPLGLALANMGDIDRQTISGATQTGTHGTGLAFGGLATMIVGMTIVTGTGEILVLTEDDRDLLDATALGLGALGIIVTVTLQCLPRFLLRADEAPAPLQQTLDQWSEIARREDHFEFYWFPHTRGTRTKTNTRLEPAEGPKPLSTAARWLDEEFVNNDVLGAVLRTERLVPRIIPQVNRLIGGISSKRTYTDWSYRVFVTTRRLRFKEAEYAVPLDDVPEVICALKRMIERNRMRISFPIEVRNAAPDNLMLSTAHGRETGYIAVHRFWRDDERAYFREVQAIMRDFNGRPHWGKMHRLARDELRDLYPRFDEFLAVRDQLDPERIFANRYLRRVLGM